MFDADPYPQKTRRVQRNRESMDLDDIMAGSDDEEEAQVVTAIKAAPTPTRRTAPPATPSSRDLMDFLSEEPPSSQPLPSAPRTPMRSTPSLASSRPAVSKATQEMMDFLAQGPPAHVEFSPAVSVSPSVDAASSRKGSGRLVRMISKLSMNDRRERTESMGDAPGRLTHKPSLSNMPLATKPVPPRYPVRSGSPSQDGGESGVSPVASPSPGARSRLPSSASNGRQEPSTWERETSSRSHNPSPAPSRSQAIRSDSNDGSYPTPHHSTSKAPLTANGTYGREDANERKKPATTTIETANMRTSRRTASGATSPARKPVPPLYPASATAKTGSSVSDDDLREMRRLFTKATSAEECRLILDLFLAKSGVTVEQADYENPYPSPSSDHQHGPGQSNSSSNASDASLEKAMVEMLLGGGPMPDLTGPRKLRSKRNIRGDAAVMVASASMGSQTPPPVPLVAPTPVPASRPASASRPPSAGVPMVTHTPRVVMQKLNAPADPVGVQAMNLL